MKYFEIRCLDKSGYCYKVRTFGTEKSAREVFDRWAVNTEKAHALMTQQGIDADGLFAFEIQLLYGDHHHFCEHDNWRLSA
ncbi:MAG: hypothetical protein ACPGQQ_08370 [Candidatus Puniceispirillaceae bacterium]